MTKRVLVFASIILLFGGVAYARSVFKFTFSDETFSNGKQGTIYASITVTNNGEVNICNYERTDGEFLGMYQDTNMLFPEHDSVDARTVENYCLRTLVVKPERRSQRLWRSLGLGRRSWPGTAQLLLVSSLRVVLGVSGQQNILTITADGVSSTKGIVGVLIFNSPRGWPNDNARAFRAVAVPAKRGSITIPVPALPTGRYAVVVLHDENQNRRLDRTWVGVPKEQWGMSNNPPVHLSVPSFKQACFMITHDEKIHVILH